MTETLTRTFNLDRKAGKGNVFPAVAATESPVLRHNYYEVLDMSRVDLSRAPLPLIESHDTNQVNIGVCENVRTDGNKLRCDVRLGSSARAQELAQDIRDGVVTGLSVGYMVDDPVETGEQDGYPVLRFKFTPHEVSAVSVPADTGAGFFRSNTTMENRETLSLKKDDNTPVAAERERAADIQSIGKEFDCQDLAATAVRNGDSVDQFRQVVLAKMNRDRVNIVDPGHYAGMPADTSRYGRALNDYSLVNVLRGLADPKALQGAGLELEISRDMARNAGRKVRGIMVPWEALATRATTVGGSGGNLKATDLLADQFIDVLRNASHVMNLGPNVLTGLEGDVAIPRKTATSTAYWIAGDGSDSITASDPTFDQVTLSPKTCGGATTFSHKLILQSSPGIEMLVRQDLADMLAVEIDRAALYGSGSSNQPLGVTNQTGIGAPTAFAAANPTYAEVVAIETAITTDNAGASNMAYLVDAAMAAHFKGTEKFSSTGQTIWEPGREYGEGRVNGYRCRVTNQVTSGDVILGDWSQLLIGFWQGIELDADPYGSNFLAGSVTVRAMASLDIAVRHPEAFAFNNDGV